MMKGGERYEKSEEERQRQEMLKAILDDAHRKVKGALREMHLAFEQLDKLKETW